MMRKSDSLRALAKVYEMEEEIFQHYCAGLYESRLTAFYHLRKIAKENNIKAVDLFEYWDELEENGLPE